MLFFICYLKVIKERVVESKTHGGMMRVKNPVFLLHRDEYEDKYQIIIYQTGCSPVL